MIRKRVSVIIVHENKILGFHAEDPTSHRKYFFLPGGMIEEGESMESAALRETLEETGYQIRLIPGIHEKRRYDFQWNGKVHDCETDFLAGELISRRAMAVNDASYHQGVDWISVDQVKSIFSYSLDILEPVQSMTAQLTKN